MIDLLPSFLFLVLSFFSSCFKAVILLRQLYNCWSSWELNFDSYIEFSSFSSNVFNLKIFIIYYEYSYANFN